MVPFTAKLPRGSILQATSTFGPDCCGDLDTKRNGDCLIITCIACARVTTDRYTARHLIHEVRMPPRAFEDPSAVQASKPLSKPELEVAFMKHQLGRHLER